MFGVTTSEDYRPVGWIGRYPVRVTSIICALLFLGMFMTVIAQTARWDITPLMFQAREFVHGKVWQPLTAPFLQTATFFFLFNLFFFYWAGNEAEAFLGVRRFLYLMGMLLLVPPIVLILWGAFGIRWVFYGSYELTVGMFIAYATLYPNQEWLGWVTLKWLAFAGLLLASMQSLPEHAWGNLTVLWGMCLVAFLFIRFAQGRFSLGENITLRNPLRRRPKLRVLPDETTESRTDDVSESVDPILDKIAKSGINSLSASERRQLDRARARLLKGS